MPSPGSRFSRSGDAPTVAAAPAALGDPVLEALAALDAVLLDQGERTARMRRRIATQRAERAAGHSYTEIVAAEPSPRLVELLADAARILDAVGADVRRTQARALHDEGMTMDEIAAWFGVSRQRVSALLRDR